MDNHLSTAVQLQFMRPRQLEDALRQFPVVYVPFGLIEWHGPHLPLGNDAIKAHAILVKTAEVHGGVVYPPVYFSESMTRDIMLPILTRLFSRLQATGFRVILGVSGHITYGQICLIRDALAPVVASGEVAGEACCEVEMRFDGPQKSKYMPDGRLFVNGRETTHQRDAENSADHAAKWETSNMMFFYPELVDLSTLGNDSFPLDMSPPWGIGGLDPRKHASVEVGRRNVELATAFIGKKAKELFESLPENQRSFNLPALIPGHWWSI